MPPGSRPAALSVGAIAEFLSSTALFRNVDRALIDKVAPHLPAAEHDAGATIVRAGSPDTGIGVLVAGRAAVRQVNASTGAATVLEELRIGDFFGEVAALLGTAQSHDIHAVEACTTLLIGREVMAQLLGKVAPFAHALAKRSAMRSVQASVAALRGGHGTAPPPVATVAATPIAAAGPSEDGGPRMVRVSAYEINDKLLQVIPARTIAMQRLLPLELRGKILTVGMVDPWNGPAQNELRRLLTTVDLQFVAISADDFNEAFVRLRIDPATSNRQLAPVTTPESLQFETNVDEPPTKQVNVIGDEVVQLANRLICAAIDRQASDVHIEGEPTGVKVRFRVGGALQDWETLVAHALAKGLVARLKVLAGLDITERRLPQDGRIGLRVGRREIDLRVATMPTLRGEKVVLRLFEAANMLRPLESIFVEPKTLAVVRAALDRPYGAIVVAGPTGSGKSSTLYACLNERKKSRPDTNAVTVEDPIEYRLGGATQVQVNHAVDLGFARILRGMLRQDPDVIMVGEVRDGDTAQLALEAAMTGHLLLTSMHANTAIAAVQRLENLGCPRPLIAQSLALVLVQRLARRLCPRCVKTEVPPPLLLDSLAARGLADKTAPVPMPRAVGCGECNGTGWSGRVAVLEAFELKDNARNMLMAGTSLADIEKQAIDAGALLPFRRYAGVLMARNLIAPSEALLVVT